MVLLKSSYFNKGALDVRLYRSALKKLKACEKDNRTHIN